MLTKAYFAPAGNGTSGGACAAAGAAGAGAVACAKAGAAASGRLRAAATTKALITVSPFISREKLDILLRMVDQQFVIGRRRRHESDVVHADAEVPGGGRRAGNARTGRHVVVGDHDRAAHAVPGAEA